MKGLVIIFLLIILSGCCKEVPITHSEQLMLDVPQELLQRPKELNRL